MKKVRDILILLMVLCIPVFAQTNRYSVVQNGQSAKIYNISGSRTTMPAYFRVDRSNSNFTITVERTDRMRFDVNFENRVEGWVVNENLLGFAFTTLALAFDFNKGIIYMLPEDISRAIIATLTPADRISVPNVSTRNPDRQDIEVLLVDAAVLRNERLERYLALVDPTGQVSLADLPSFTPNSREVLTVPATRGGIVVKDRPVITAAANGQRDLLQRLLTEGASINEVEIETGDNALFKTIAAGNEDMAGILMQSGINVKHKNRYGQNALHLASGRGLRNVSEKLMAAGINPNDRDNSGNTALMYAAQSPNASLIDLLVSRGARLEDRNNKGSTPLAMAAYFGNTRNAELLLNFGANPAAVDNDGNSVLMEALKGNSDFIVNKLLDQPSVNINSLDMMGNTPLHTTILRGNDNVSGILLDRGADVNAKNNDGRTPMMLAVLTNNNNILQKILTKNPDIFLTDNEGRTAHALAAASGTAVNRTLNDALRNADKQTVKLFELVAANDITGVKTLLENGARPNASDIETGNTPLFAAVANNYRDMSQILIDRGANVNWQNKKGNTPLILAVSTGDERALEILLKAGAHTNIQNDAGDTALIWAVKLHRLDFVRALLVANANPNIRNFEGISPLMVARGENHREIEQILRSFGAF